MPIYNLVCKNNHEQIDVLLKLGERPPCPVCGGATETLWSNPTTASNIIGDEIPGGMWVRHGICNPDGTPRKYYTKSEMAAEAKKRGLVNHTDLPDRVIKNRKYFT